MRWQVLALLLCTGCGALLDIEDGTLLEQDGRCDQGDERNCGLDQVCIAGKCEIGCSGDDTVCPSGMHCSGTTADAMRRTVKYCASTPPAAEAAPFVTRFTGTSASFAILGDYLYYAHPEGIFACAKADCASGATSVGANAVNVSSVVRFGSTSIAWIDTAFIGTCAAHGPLSCGKPELLSESASYALSADDTTGTIAWLGFGSEPGGVHQLRAWSKPGAPRMIAPLPTEGRVKSATAIAGADAFFAMIDGRVYSISGGATALVTDEEHRNLGAAALTVVAGRAVWVLESAGAQGLFQCAIQRPSGSPPSICDGTKVGPLATTASGVTITALTSTSRVVYWAERRPSGVTEVRSCMPAGGDASAAPPRCDLGGLPPTIATFHGRVAKMIVDGSSLYLLTTEEDAPPGQPSLTCGIRRVAL